MSTNRGMNVENIRRIHTYPCFDPREVGRYIPSVMLGGKSTPRASFDNCVHTLQGIEARFQRVAERNCRKHAGRGPHIPMAYCTATLRSMAQTVSLNQCWVAAEQALR